MGMVLILVTYALALARLTRLINADTVLDGPRGWVAGREKRQWSIAHGLQANLDQAQLYEHHRRIARRWSTAMYFIQCPWCVGLWLTLATAWVPLWYADDPVARYAGVALAVSHLIGVCARFADTEDIDFEDETVS